MKFDMHLSKATTRALAALVGMFLLITGCGGGSSGSSTTTPPPGSVTFRQLNDLNSLNGPATAATVVIHNTTEWSQLWGPGETAAPPPSVNFMQEYVLVIALGAKANTAWGISVTSVVDSGAVIQVTAQQTYCAGNSGAAISYPATAITVSATTKPFSFTLTGPTC